MSFTPYTQVNALLAQLLVAVPAILIDRFVGMYLYGSLALGDFDPAVSDIDFLVAVNDDVTNDQFDRLRVMHDGISRSGLPLSTDLEGSYIALRALRRHDPTDAIHPHIDRGGGLTMARHDTDWVIRYWMVREHGIVLAGPSPKELVEPVGPRGLKRAILDMMWWWEQQLEETYRVAQDGYRWYTVQTMCRILYTMATGEIVSKPTASRWALTHLDPGWQPLIKRAMGWRPPAKMDRLEETLEFVRETLRLVDQRARAEGLR